ncbi:YihY/virulence factor BrkB family protein [Pontibacter chitinilyticus]|uniref:YihY/virulence factor BrkB family protein n=1 Tax=Pontibacter chitinilyticus TaxID=2674989 RepID=UPI00321A4BED
MKHIKHFFSNSWHIIKAAAANFRNGEPIVYSAAIAFFTIFSLPAILIVLTQIGSAFFARQQVRGQIISEVGNLISARAGAQVSTLLENLMQVPSGFWGVLISVIVVIQSASISFFIMQKALNAVWHIKVKPGIGFKKLLRRRLSALAMVGGLGLLLILSLLLNTAIAMYREQLLNLFEEFFTPAIRTINTLFYLLVVLIFFTSVHKVLPDAKVHWKDALAGGIITSILFLIGKQLINYLLSSVKIVGIYATAGSFVVVLLWVFYSSVILLLGAEVTRAYANHYGRFVKPTAIAYKYEEVSSKEA